MEAVNLPSEHEQISQNTLDHLSKRAERLLGELRQFQQALNDNSRRHDSEIRVFRRGVESEVKSLQTIRNRQAKQLAEELLAEGDSDDAGLRCAHALNSSNLPFYEAVWRTAKTCQNITGLGRRVYLDSPSQQPMPKSTSGEKRHGATVDIVAENGLKWIKVSTINNKRLLFEMAKQGWENYGDFSSDEDDFHASDGEASPDEKRKQLDLMKTAETIVKASRAHRVQFQHPRVLLMLPNVREHEYEDVDSLLQDLRTMGMRVDCDSALRESKSLVPVETNLDASTIESLIPDVPPSILNSTQVLNLDCTILLALISDISHITEENLPPQPTNRSGTYHKAILRQIEGEKTQALLPTEIYPILDAKALQTTLPAAERMFKIVHTMGTDLERMRTDILLGQGSYANKSAAQLRQELQLQSCHPVPEILNIPIKIIDFQDLLSDETQPPNLQNLKLSAEQHEMTTRTTMSKLDSMIAHKLTTKIALSKINTSVFLYGWSRNIVTLTSNKIVATGINKAVDEMLDEYELQLHDQSIVDQPTGESHGTTKSLHNETTNRERGGKSKGSRTLDSGIQPDPLIGFVGPKIYICETARSLIGKEKQVPLVT